MAQLHKTRGIVLGYVRYRETSIIAKIYTESFGVQTYIENGVRSAKGKNKIALFQPLTLLDLVIYHDEKKEIHRISEIRCHTPYQTLPFDILKSSIALFLNEILSKTLKEQEENRILFEFLFHAFVELDQSDGHFENFHLVFLLKLSFFLGFSADNAEEISQQFKQAHIGIDFSPEQRQILNAILKDTVPPPFNRFTRNHLVEIMVLYYALHVEDLGEIKSLQVLREVMS